MIINMAIRDSHAWSKKLAELNAQALEELSRVHRRNGCKNMADFWISKGWFTVGKSGEIILNKRPRWQSEADVIDGIRLLAKTEGIDPARISYGFLEENGFEWAIIRFFDGSHYRALRAAFPEIGIQPWELSETPKGFFDDPEERKRATRWLAETRLSKDPRELSKADFHDNGLAGLLHHPEIRGSPWRLISEAYPEIKPWELKRMPAGVELSGKELCDMVVTRAGELGIDPMDLPRGRVPGSVLKANGNSILNVLIAAGIATEEDRKYVECKGARKSAERRSIRALRRNEDQG